MWRRTRPSPCETHEIKYQKFFRRPWGYYCSVCRTECENPVITMAKGLVDVLDDMQRNLFHAVHGDYLMQEEP